MIVSVPDSAKKLLPGVLFSGNQAVNKVFLTFDDGPIPEVTIPVLDLLEMHGAVATFFEVGENVLRYPEVHQRIISDGHQVANHTFNHLSGWKTKTEDYISNVEKANKLINSNFFRPPYGRITPNQLKKLKQANYKIVYWNVLSKDYDQSLTPEQCLKNVKKNLEKGSIILLHDSLKAKNNVLGILPKILEEIKNRGYEFGRIEEV